MAVAKAMPFSRSARLLIVDPVAAVAVPLKATLNPDAVPIKVTSEVGFVKVTVGAWPVTVIVRVTDLLAPLLSVARNTIEWTPTLSCLVPIMGATTFMAAPLALANCVPLSVKTRLIIFSPVLGVALPEKEIETPLPWEAMV